MVSSPTPSRTSSAASAGQGQGDGRPGAPTQRAKRGSWSPRTLRLVAGAWRRRSQPTLLPARRVIALKFASDRGQENGRGGGSAGPRGAARRACPPAPSPGPLGPPPPAAWPPAALRPAAHRPPVVESSRTRSPRSGG